MFFYLGFLRPPPRASKVTALISTTPQLSNDLRTSYPDAAHDFFYAWVPASSYSSFSFGLHSFADGTTPGTKKLTTWRGESSMYKSLKIPLPPNAKRGQMWRLALTTGSSADGNKSLVVNLAEVPFGVRPFPVVSMPLRLEDFEDKDKNKTASKQEQIERLYTIDSDSTCLLCIREQTSFDLDKKIWDSGIALSSWFTNVLLKEEDNEPSISVLKTILTTPKLNDGLRIIELGTGTGIVSICLSAILEKLQNAQNVHILATDLPRAIELIEHNIASNKNAFQTLSLKAAVLDWDQETASCGPLNLVIMADVTYNNASFPALVRTIAGLVESSKLSSPNSKTPAVLLAYKQRDPSERELWPMLQDIGIHLELVDRVGGAGGEAVEIWFWFERSEMTLAK